MGPHSAETMAKFVQVPVHFPERHHLQQHFHYHLAHHNHHSSWLLTINLPGPMLLDSVCEPLPDPDRPPQSIRGLDQDIVGQHRFCSGRDSPLQRAMRRRQIHSASIQNGNPTDRITPILHRSLTGRRTTAYRCRMSSVQAPRLITHSSEQKKCNLQLGHPG